MCARSTWILDVEAGWTHDSNLPRAQLTNDIKSGSALTAAFSAGRFFAPDERNSFTLAADARAARHAQTNRMRPGAGLSLYPGAGARGARRLAGGAGSEVATQRDGVIPPFATLHHLEISRLSRCALVRVGYDDFPGRPGGRL